MRLSKKDGSLQVYYASENANNDQDILMQSSRDGGQTWSAPTTVAGGTTTGRDGMPGCTSASCDTARMPSAELDFARRLQRRRREADVRVRDDRGARHVLREERRFY